jgi:hypothetical protein
LTKQRSEISSCRFCNQLKMSLMDCFATSQRSHSCLYASCMSANQLAPSQPQ